MACLFILHYHFRPGGVRSVVERFLQAWGASQRWESVVLAGGEAPDHAWLTLLEETGSEIEVRVDSRLGYSSESPRANGTDIRETLEAWIRETRPDLLWVHNLSVGRNAALGQAVGQLEVPLLCHHHDWWMQHRWERWNEFGMDSFKRAAEAILPDGPHLRHACAHPADAAILKRNWGERVAWIVPPPPGAPFEATPPSGREPFWLAPCRILRRKNLLEALLLCRWFRPGGRMVISGSVSSAAETAYGHAVRQAATLLGVPLETGAAAGSSMDHLYRDAEAVMQTSVMEGFGLTAWEAAVRKRPLLLRRLDHLTSALEKSGTSVPGIYDDVMLPPSFVSIGERQRQTQGWHRKCALLPEPWRSAALKLPEPDRAAAIPFSSLTVAGQLEILGDWARLHDVLADHNPWLLRPNLFHPTLAGSWAGDSLIQIEQLLRAPSSRPSSHPVEIVAEILRNALPTARNSPLLW